MVWVTVVSVGDSSDLWCGPVSVVSVGDSSDFWCG